MIRPDNRPGAGSLDLGQVTPRIVDRLHRTKTWARAVAVISFLSIAAVLVFCGAAWFHSEEEAFLAPLALGLAGVLALAALLPAISLYRFAQTVEQMTQWNRGQSVASAFEDLGSFWRRAGCLLAGALGACFLILWLARPELASFVAAARNPQGTAQQEEKRETRPSRSPLVLREARFGRNAPLWVPTPNPPASPGRSFTFEEIGEACQVADTTFLCLINRPGEWVGGGSRQVITGDDAIFTVLPQTAGTREILEVALTGNDDRPWRLRLGPQMGFPLMKITYEGTSESTIGTAHPFLAFYGGSLYCRNDHGRFHVQELVWGADGLPDRLVVDFQVECDLGPPALGRLSMQASSRPLTDR